MKTNKALIATWLVSLGVSTYLAIKASKKQMELLDTQFKELDKQIEKNIKELNDYLTNLGIGGNSDEN